jgi:hypothetical protein
MKTKNTPKGKDTVRRSKSIGTQTPSRTWLQRYRLCRFRSQLLKTFSTLGQIKVLNLRYLRLVLRCKKVRN